MRQSTYLNNIAEQDHRAINRPSGMAVLQKRFIIRRFCFSDKSTFKLDWRLIV